MVLIGVTVRLEWMGVVVLGSHRANGFDLMRHLAAMAVLISHHYALSKMAVPQFLGIFSYGAFAVLVFFAISGYLVTKSFYGSSSFWLYFERRIRRLFPGLIVCSAVMVIFLCGFMGQRSAVDYIFSQSAYNSFMSSVWMEGMVDINKFSHDYKYPNAINGSLWTLRYEFFCYLIIPVALIVARRSYKILWGVLVAGLAVQIYSAAGNSTIVSLWRLSLLMIPFVVGGLMFFTESLWRGKRLGFFMFILAVMFVIFSPRGSYFQPFFYIFLSIIIVGLGLVLKDRIIAGRFDFSYGIYIYAFPIQQLMINEVSLGFYTSMFASIIFTLLAAALSWYFVEKPFIRRTPSSKMTANGRSGLLDSAELHTTSLK